MPQLTSSIVVVTDTTIFMSCLDSGTKGNIFNLKLKMLIKVLKMLIFCNTAMQLLSFFFFFFKFRKNTTFSPHNSRHVRSDQGLNLHPLHWKQGVLTTRDCALTCTGSLRPYRL